MIKKSQRKPELINRTVAIRADFRPVESAPEISLTKRISDRMLVQRGNWDCQPF